MKKYKFAWSCLGFTMLMPLFISENIGIYLTIGVVISCLVFFISTMNWDGMPQELKDKVNESFKNSGSDEDIRTSPMYSYLPGNIYYNSDD
jgi:hypothetical protein